MNDDQRLMAGASAVLALHQPHPNYVLSNGKPAPGSTMVCAVCVDFHADMDCEQQQYPCETVRLLTDWKTT